MLGRARQGYRQRTQKLPHQHHPKREWEVIRTFPWGRGQRPMAPEQCGQAMCQLDDITIAPSPVKPLPSKPGARERELKPSVALDLATPTPMNPDFLLLAMDQCGQRLNEQGELVLTNTMWLSTHHYWIPGLEGHTHRSGSRGGRETVLCFSCWNLRGNEGNWKSGSVGCHCFLPFPLHGNGLLFYQSTYDLGKADHIIRSYEE